jgi:hypothetical protein
MRKHNTAWFVLFWGLCLVLVSTVAVAQGDEQPAEDTEPAAEQSEVSEDSPDFVYTMEYLKKRAENAQATGVTNKTLDDQFAEPAQTSGSAITNDDLQDRFGEEAEEGEEAAEDETSDTEEATEPAAAAEPTEPSMSDAERAELITELEAKIGELQEQLDELREE